MTNCTTSANFADASAISFDQLYSKYHRLVRFQAARVCAPSDVEDVVQDTFLRIHRKLHTFRGDAPLEGWIARIAHNSALMHRRKSVVRHEVCVGDDVIATHRDEVLAETPATALARKRVVAALYGALEGFDEERRRLLVMRGEEYSMGEIAQALGISEAAAKSRLHRARAALRSEMERVSA